MIWIYLVYVFFILEGFFFFSTYFSQWPSRPLTDILGNEWWLCALSLKFGTETHSSPPCSYFVYSYPIPLSGTWLAKKNPHKDPGPKNESLKSNLLICYLFRTAGQSLDIALPVLDQEKVLFLILRSANLTGVRGRWPLKKILTGNKSIRWFLNEPRLLIQLPLSNKKGKSVH